MTAHQFLFSFLPPALFLPEESRDSAAMNRKPVTRVWECLTGHVWTAVDAPACPYCLAPKPREVRDYRSEGPRGLETE